MRNKIFVYFLFFIFSHLNLLAVTKIHKNKDDPRVVVGKLEFQMGNNLFQLATTLALAWDNQAIAYFPDLICPKNNQMKTNAEHVFFRCNTIELNSLKIFKKWFAPIETNFYYFPIPFKPNMSIRGKFQCEKYFKHHRDKLLEVFEPSSQDLAYIKNTYQDILNHPQTVGIQIRWFGVQKDKGWWDDLVQYGHNYLQKAMDLFPQETLFIVSTNDLEFARLNVPQKDRNVIFLEGEPHYIDFFLLSMCKHNIITNSTFGWWAAWLNKNLDKIVVVPSCWVDPNKYGGWNIDVWPKEWIQIDATWNKPNGLKEKI